MKEKYAEKGDKKMGYANYMERDEDKIFERLAEMNKTRFDDETKRINKAYEQMKKSGCGSIGCIHIFTGREC